jgi:sugar lactone lactonase YvrE
VAWIYRSIRILAKAIDGRGRLYFTELNGAAVYRIDAPGKLARILAAPDIRRPNGIQVSPDDRKPLRTMPSGVPT